MKPVLPNTLARALRGFFVDHLPRVRGASPHTVSSYRDTFVLLLRFVARQKQRAVPELDVDHLGPQEILDFLHDLEVERHNIAATRNVRLAAIHAFFRYCAAEHPQRIEHCQRVLAVPFKRARSRPVEYLEFAEIQAVLAAIDRSTTNGRRDYALLASMFNTGARVQEIVALRVSDLRLESPPHLRLFGKGRKERICPLWSQTADLLRALLAERGTNQTRADQPLFVNHHGEPLTRFGVRYILAKYCAEAREAMPTLATKRLHPHSMRHSTAVHLLRSGVDIVTISQWLGHASVTTTNRYATVDLEMKRKAIEQARPIDETAAGIALWRSDTSILTWLEAL
jgi:integrase/recombinase XerD